MIQIKEYLKTFKPVDFPSNARLVGSIIFILCIYLLFFVTYFNIGLINGFPLFVNMFYLIPLCFIISVLLFLAIDNTMGFGRNYSQRGEKNFWIFLPLCLFFLLHYLLII
jgi:hypothetical protein